MESCTQPDTDSIKPEKKKTTADADEKYQQQKICRVLNNKRGNYVAITQSEISRWNEPYWILWYIVCVCVFACVVDS